MQDFLQKQNQQRTAEVTNALIGVLAILVVAVVAFAAILVFRG